MRDRRTFAALSVAFACALAGGKAEASSLREEALGALWSAAVFYKEHVALEGGYVWAYSPDMEVRRGEGGPVEASVNWTQPPGTPAVGGAYLRAYEATGDRYFLNAALDAAHGLADAQLLSGGWWYWVETDPELRTDWCYRSNPEPEAACEAIEDNPYKNSTTLDDDTTQSVIRFLLDVDRATQGQDERVRGALIYALRGLVEGQYPNGAWPVRSDRAPPREAVTSAYRARLPEDWPREFEEPEGQVVYQTNDHVVRDAVRTLLAAHRQHGEPAYLTAAVRAGDFLLAARLPEPQPGWAQLYDADLIPAWGRAFEPPALASAESAGAIDALLDLHAYTGKPRFFEDLAASVGWLRRSALPEGGWARFYELGSNRPLYVTPELTLAHEPTALHEGYSFRGGFGIPEVLARYEAVAGGAAGSVDTIEDEKLAKRARRAIRSLDEEGRWIDGEGWISSKLFVDNVEDLAAYLEEPGS